ncbi:MAG: DUF84 family protein [Candidatus Kaiserbacteria bacterium]|nr:DUF84 family protein [Candidatus Kaiserbacteria bacterium]MCB9816798.1 DUF84 family protein [Candidatus Nomurabacteria bacterium]
MKKVIVGSNNPVKLEATERAFTAAFPGEQFSFFTHSAPSGVSDQPMGDDETKLGAENRAAACREAYPDADYFVGLEGGLILLDDEYWTSAWMCVQDTAGKISFGRTGAFLLPPRVSELIDQGEELGVATDIAFNETNSKHKGGAVGVLTNDVVNRADYYFQPLIFALIPFVKPELYP